MGKTLEILVCDDCAEDAAALAELVSEYGAHTGISVSVTCCQSAAQVREHAQARAFDALLLDVYLKGAGGGTGIDLARALRADGYGGAIVFTTVSRDHALDAYQVDAAQYLVKPLTLESVFHALDQIRCARTEPAPSLLVTAGGRLIRITYSSFVFSETRRHYQHITTIDGALERVRMSGAELFAKFGGNPAFVRVGASYIVNLAHVLRLTPKSLELTGGHRVPLPRGAYQHVKARYFAYYTDQEA